MGISGISGCGNDQASRSGDASLGCQTDSLSRQGTFRILKSCQKPRRVARVVENLGARFVWGEQEPGDGAAALFGLRVFAGLERLGLDLREPGRPVRTEVKAQGI